MKTFTKTERGWVGVTLAVKELIFKSSSQHLRIEDGWKFDNKPPRLLLELSVTNSTAVESYTIGFLNSTSTSLPDKVVRIVDEVEYELQGVATSVQTTYSFPSGSSKIRIECSGGNQLVLTENNIFTSINVLESTQNFYPSIRSSVLTSVPTTLPPSITDLRYAFHSCSSFNQLLTDWDTSRVVSMEGLFSGCTAYNQPLTFDMSNVVNLSYILQGCANFNQPINFDTPKCKTFSLAFQGCLKLNQPINIVSTAATHMTGMFQNCKQLNSPVVLSSTANVTLMNYMFNGTSVFNQNLTSWDVSKVTNWNHFRTSSALSIANTPAKFR